MRAILCSFSGAIDRMRQIDQKDRFKVLAVLDKHPRFSAFDATANAGIARTLTRLKDEGYITYPEPQPGYPWCKVALTDKAREALAQGSV